ncbi:MAG: protein kinase domain-containing protein [Persicimonas sp.]
MTSSAASQRLGPYELVRKVGEGAAGEVFLARHSILERDYAIKVLRSEYVSNEYFTERFLQEARHAAQLIHPNIVPVVTADRDGDTYYLVMEYVDGVSLDELADDEPLEPRRAVNYVHKILGGLEYAHQQGLLHRDVKAENILLGGDGEPKLTDFGLVLHVEQETRLTAQNAVVGTPNYMAPEQWRSEELDVRADVFAAGVLLYYLLTSRFPFPGETPVQVFHRMTSGEHSPLGLLPIRNNSPVTTAELRSALTAVVDRALARERDERFESAADFADALEAWLEEAGGATRVSQLDEPTRPREPISSTGFSSAENLDFHSTGHQSSPGTQDPTMTHDSVNLSVSPVEIAENTYWVGKRPDDEIFFANPYLRHFPGADGQGDFNLLIDPGSSSDFSVVQSKVSQVIGSIKKVSSIYINHQDPDVGSSVGLMMGRYTPKAYVLCSEDTWRLVHYYNIPRKRFVALEKYPRGLRLPTDDVVVPVPSPFCHFVGAVMLYDPSTRVLFSGDLFGGLTDRGAKGLYADDSDWTGMRAFHQIYMPTQKALQNAIHNIRQLDPFPEIIAPQHGRVITGHYVQEYLERLEHLPVGLDILEDRNASDDELQAWTTVLSRVLEAAKAALGDQAEVLLADDPNLSGIITFTGSGVEVTSLGKTSVERAVRLLCAHVPRSVGSSLKYEAIFAASELDLPTPMIELDEEGEDAGAAPEEVNRSPDFKLASAE